MATWKQVNVGNPTAACAAFCKLESAFMAYAMSVGGRVPYGYGVFAGSGPRNDTIWYFSPDAAALGEKFDAQSCEKPVPAEDFSLLVGEQRSTTLHFPDYFARDRRG